MKRNLQRTKPNETAKADSITFESWFFGTPVALVIFVAVLYAGISEAIGLGVTPMVVAIISYITILKTKSKSA